MEYKDYYWIVFKGSKAIKKVIEGKATLDD